MHQTQPFNLIRKISSSLNHKPFKGKVPILSIPVFSLAYSNTLRVLRKHFNENFFVNFERRQRHMYWVPTGCPEWDVPIFIPNEVGSIVMTAFLEEEMVSEGLGDLSKFTENTRNRPGI